MSISMTKLLLMRMEPCSSFSINRPTHWVWGFENEEGDTAEGMIKCARTPENVKK